MWRTVLKRPKPATAAGTKRYFGWAERKLFALLKYSILIEIRKRMLFL
jgi:hypothetical protein